MTFKVKNLSSPQTDWKISVNGRDITTKTTLVQLDSRWGTLTFGDCGYPSWKWRESGGGGAVTLLYAFHPEGELMIGLVWEDRPNMGGRVLCAIGGMHNVGETHTSTQAREAREEAGIDSTEAKLLPGQPVTLNRLFDITDPGEGVKMYAIEIPFGSLSQSGGYYKLNNEVFRGDQSDGVAFLPWKEAVCACRDACALSAIAKLCVTVL